MNYSLALLTCMSLGAMYEKQPSFWESFKEASRQYRENYEKHLEEERRNQYRPHPYPQPHVLRNAHYGYHFLPLPPEVLKNVIHNPTPPSRTYNNVPFQAMICEWAIQNDQAIKETRKLNPHATVADMLKLYQVPAELWQKIQIVGDDGQSKPLTQATLQEFEKWVGSR